MEFSADANVLYGNACDVEVTRVGKATEVRFAADPHGGPECLWFCFRVRRLEASSTNSVRLVLKHFGNLLGGSDLEKMRPVVRYDSGDWERLDPGVRMELPDGRVQGVWDVDAPETFFDAALCYPYGRAEVDRLVRDAAGYWRKDTIGVSQAGRPLVRLSNDPGAPGCARAGLYLVARQHSGETPGSWVLDGFLRRMAEFGDEAPLIWAIPLSNIDGVEQGDYGKDNFPYDLNRAWSHPPMRHETHVFGADVRGWSNRCRPVLGIDFHAPGGCESDGVYTHVPDPKAYPEMHTAVSEWAEAIKADLTRLYAAEDFGRVAKYASRWETPSFTKFFCATFEKPALTLETPYATCGETLMTCDSYRDVGARLAETIAGRLGAADDGGVS